MIAAQKQPANLSDTSTGKSKSVMAMTPKKAIKEGVKEFKDLYSCIEKKNCEVCISNPSHKDFVSAKQLVYHGMSLIDDKIGIFHIFLVDAEGQSYLMSWRAMTRMTTRRRKLRIGLSSLSSPVINWYLSS